MLHTLLKWCGAFALLCCVFAVNAQDYTATSPNGLLKIKVSISSTIQYEVLYDDELVITPSVISLALNTGLTLGSNATVSQTTPRSVNEPITRLYGKNAEISDHFNELKIDFTESYSLILRAYDEGVAYRFQTTLGGNVIVNAEEANFNFAHTTGVIFPEADVAMQSWERSYSTYASLQDVNAGKFAVTPTLFSDDVAGLKVVIAESDLLDYPGMYLQRNAGTGVKGKWAQYPKTVSDPDDVYKYHRVLTREDYLAKTSGTRSYPWRVVIVSADDRDLLNNELIFKLASPQVITNTSWIKPGKSAWEWWHDAILENSQIPSGKNNLNYNLYKYYVDFAAHYRLEYITMDAGWSMDFAPQICQYAASKNVKVFVWDFINLPVTNPARLTQIKNMGAAGVKVDLIERDDQVAINWFQQLAKDCADRGLMIIFHGCAKPTGLQRMYPNIMNFEAVRGAECDKWDNSANPNYHLQFPFIRMLAGPLDYTPGSMRNVHPSEFTPRDPGIPMSIGTRVHEMAMYVMFDQPLGFLCDSPTEYKKFPDIMTFLGNVPTDWEQTLPLVAKVGEYAVVARKKGDEWYVGGMTNGEARDLEIDFSFLPDGVERMAEVFRDNTTTDTNAKAYTHEVFSVTNATKKSYHLSPGGGVAIRIRSQVTGTKGEETGSTMKVYQNPQRTQLTIESAESIRSIHIIDVSGRVHYEEVVEDQLPSRRIDTSGLASGLYIVYMTTPSNFYSQKFIK